MSNIHELTRGHKQLRALIAFALAEGWRVVRTHGGHLKFTRPGYATLYTGSTPSNHRVGRNARARLRRAKRQVLAPVGLSSLREDEHD